MAQADLTRLHRETTTSFDDMRRRLLLASSRMSSSQLADLADLLHDLRRARHEDMWGEREMMSRRH